MTSTIFFRLKCPLSKMLILIILKSSLIINVSSCSHTNKFLNEKEIYYMKKNNYHNISIIPDVKAIKQNKFNGVYSIIVSPISHERYPCRLDTNAVKKIAIEKAITIKKFMNFKENYEYIDVLLESLEKNELKNSLGEDISCRYTIRIPINNFLFARIINANNNNDVISLFSRP